MTREIKKRSVIVTRPAPGAEKTCQQVAALGWHVIWHPLLQIEMTPRQRPEGRFTMMVVTSAQVIPALKDISRDIPIVAVGAATAKCLSDHGFIDITICAGNAASIVAHLGMSPPSARILFPTGAHLGLKLSYALRRNGWNVIRYLTYKSSPITSLSDSLIAEIKSGAVDSVLFFSSKTTSAWVGAASASHIDTREMRAIVLSAPIASRLSLSNWRDISVSQTPDHDGILQSLGMPLTVKA